MSFVADTVGAIGFHDYPQMGLDADGLYICTQDFDGAAVRESCYSIPKADLLLAVPSVANLTRFESGAGGNLTAVSGSWQPARNLGGISLGRAALLGAAGGNLQRNDIFGATGPGAFLSGTIAIAGDPGHAGPPPARQPPDPAGENNTIENVAPRFVANPVIVPGHPATTQSGYSMWAAHAVQGSAANSAIQWYEIDEGTDTVLQSGLIDDPDRDFHEPSIGANEDGQVVIGYTCSGPTLPASACASVGDTDGTGTTNFQSPAILFAGSGHYYRDGCVNPAVNLCSERNRWGDYSATVTDPSDACTFWTFQEYTAQGATVDVGPVPDDVDGGQWGIRVVELIYTQCLGGDLAVTKVCKPDTALRPGETAFCDITVTNFGPGKALGVSLLDRILSDGTFTLSRPETLCRITSFRSMSRMDASLMKASALRLRFSQSTAAAVEPGDGAFDHPTPGLDDEALHPIGSLDDLGLEIGQDAGQGTVKDRALIGAVGEQFPEKGKQTEQGRQQRETAVAILNVGGGDDAVQQQALRIDQNMPLLALDQLAGIEAVAVDASPPFSALFTL